MSAIATRTPANLDQLRLIPYPAEQLDKMWAWLHEFPKSSFDDSTPADDFDLFRLIMLGKAKAGQKLIAAELAGDLVGAIAFKGMTSKHGKFGGIVFSKEVHGMGVAFYAVNAVLAACWAEGYEVITANYFADNHRVHAFLKKLGAVNKGYRIAETTRNGKPVDVRDVAFFRPREIEEQT